MVGGLKFSMAQKQICKSSSWEIDSENLTQVGRTIFFQIRKRHKPNVVPAVGGYQPAARTNWEKLSDFLGTIFILIHFYLISTKNEHYSLS